MFPSQEVKQDWFYLTRKTYIYTEWTLVKNDLIDLPKPLWCVSHASIQAPKETQVVYNQCKSTMPYFDSPETWYCVCCEVQGCICE